MLDQPIIVLKFGSSVLRGQDDLTIVSQEIYRWIRSGHKVVAVVSAFEGETDELLDIARSFGTGLEHHAVSQLVSTGELKSAAYLALDLTRKGIPNEVVDAAGLRLITNASLLDAQPESVDITRLRKRVERSSVVIIPGFTGRSRAGQVTLLGRGGSDWTALFIARQLKARCRLIKDVPGLYEWDPHQPGSKPRLYRQLSWTDALQLDNSIVQHRAISDARDHEQVFEVAALLQAEATRIGPFSPQFASTPFQFDRPKPRIAVLGAGTVGRGVIRQLIQLANRIELVAVAVRDQRKHADLATGVRLVRADQLTELEYDVLVDVSGDSKTAFEMAADVLQRGRAFVTADKHLIARKGQLLSELATRNRGRLLFSAAVGGSMPALETIRRLVQKRSIVKMRGILNGTCNFVLDQLSQGDAIHQAVQKAADAGLAESDVSRDLNGIDAVDKLVLAIHAATGRWIPPGSIRRQKLDQTALKQLHRLSNNLTLRQIAECDLSRGLANAQVRLSPVPVMSVVGRCRGCENVLVIELDDGSNVSVRGTGAGRWPTALSVVADILDLSRFEQNNDGVSIPSLAESTS